MPQSLARLIIHLIFSTKDRALSLADEALRRDLHAYLAATARDLGCPGTQPSTRHDAGTGIGRVEKQLCARPGDFELQGIASRFTGQADDVYADPCPIVDDVKRGRGKLGFAKVNDVHIVAGG